MRVASTSSFRICHPASEDDAARDAQAGEGLNDGEDREDSLTSTGINPNRPTKG